MNQNMKKAFEKNKKLIYVLAGVVLVALPFALRSPYHQRVLIMVGIYMILASSLNIMIGFTGLFSLGHAAFFGIGAYASAILSTRYGVPFWFCLPIAGIIAGLFGAFLGLATLRLRAIFLAFTTLGFGEITRIIILNWISFTRGPMGITGIPVPKIFGVPFSSYVYYYFLILALVILVVFLIHRLVKSRIGRALIAIREDELAAQTMGARVFGYKVLAFTITCFFAGVVGSFYAHFARYISADQFAGVESFAILIMIALGGTGSLAGPLIGALILVLFPEIFRFLIDFRMVLYGLVLIVVIAVRPQGIAGVKGLFTKPVQAVRRKRSKAVGESV